MHSSTKAYLGIRSAASLLPSRTISISASTRRWRKGPITVSLDRCAIPTGKRTTNGWTASPLNCWRPIRIRVRYARRFLRIVSWLRRPAFRAFPGQLPRRQVDLRRSRHWPRDHRPLARSPNPTHPRNGSWASRLARFVETRPEEGRVVIARMLASHEPVIRSGGARGLISLRREPSPADVALLREAAHRT